MYIYEINIYKEREEKFECTTKSTWKIPLGTLTFFIIIYDTRQKLFIAKLDSKMETVIFKVSEGNLQRERTEYSSIFMRINSDCRPELGPRLTPF